MSLRLVHGTIAVLRDGKRVIAPLASTPAGKDGFDFTADEIKWFDERHPGGLSAVMVQDEGPEPEKVPPTTAEADADAAAKDAAAAAAAKGSPKAGVGAPKTDEDGGL